MDSTRKYDLIVFGATGFTGTRVCDYLVEVNDQNLRWAIAGRSLPKLEAVRDRLAKQDPFYANLPLIIADSSQPETLDAALAETRVVLSTVGPFKKYGTPLVDACIRQKTHYVDTTGEYNWIREIIDKYHEKAKEEHILIVPACGFDSVPSDLGTFMVCDYIRQKYHLNVADVKASMIKIKGGASGGTLHSSIGAISDTSVPQSSAMDPYFLSPVRGLSKIRLPSMYRDRDFGRRWQAFYVMSAINEKIVQRTWGLLTERNEGYGRLFRYKESMSFSFLPAFLLTTVLFTLFPVASILLRLSWFKRAVLKALPSSGSGPSDEDIKTGHFEFHIVATAETEPYDERVRARGIVKGFRDPGYGDTCRMAAESALSIIKSYPDLPGKEGGVLTSATAFGHVLLERLRRNNGMVFEVQDL